MGLCAGFDTQELRDRWVDEYLRKSPGLLARCESAGFFTSSVQDYRLELLYLVLEDIEDDDWRRAHPLHPSRSEPFAAESGIEGAIDDLLG